MKDKYIEMEYTSERIVTILDKGKYLKYNYVIVNYGAHPCAYVRIPKRHIFFGKGYSGAIEEKINVHGGVTFSSPHLPFDNTSIISIFGKQILKITWKPKNEWWIGWDYAHCGDYYGIDLILPSKYSVASRKWKVEDIRDDVKMAIAGLIREEKE